MSAYNEEKECEAYNEEKECEISEHLGKKACCAKNISNQDADELAKMETYKIMLKHLKS